MKKLLAAVAAGSGFVFGASLAGATGAYDHVSGAGWRGTPFDASIPAVQFAISAHDGPEGVFGTFNVDFRFANVSVRGDVRCLGVSGNHAIAGGVVTASSVPAWVGQGFAVGFIDNPRPAPDTTTLVDVPIAALPVDCTAEAPSLFGGVLRPFVRGNVEILDAP